MDFLDSTDPIMMETQSGDKLELRVDVPCMRRLRRLDPPIDIRKIIDPDDEMGGLYGLIKSDPSVVVDIAYEATRTKANADQTPEEFAAGLYGDALGELTEKVLEAVVRFIPDRKNRQAYQAIMDKTESIADEMMNQAISKINSGEMDREVMEALDEVERNLTISTPSESIGESSSSAESSDSTQEDHTRSES